jgi:hypothetical protein
MEYLIGSGLAVVVCTFAMLAGFDRDRVFYPMLVAVIATYYILFAVMGSSTRVLAGVPESRRFSRASRGRVQAEPLADCGCPHRTRNFRFLSSCIHSEPRCSRVVARLLPFIRRSRRRFPCHAADATKQVIGDLARIRTRDLELRRCVPL